MIERLFGYFTDPVIGAPLIGSMIMCLVIGIIGSFVVLKKQSLVGEMLSHACYPGVILALILAKTAFSLASDLELTLVPILGAMLSCFAGMYIQELLQKRFGIHADSALCFVLTAFFGIAIVLLSSLQGPYPTLYRELQAYLFGQAATQTSFHEYLYAVFGMLVLVSIFLFYRLIKTTVFDREFAKTIGFNVYLVDFVLISLIVLAVVIGIRTLGVVLLSSMLIYPGVSARLWTDRLEVMLFLAALFGIGAGFLGVVLSHEMSLIWTKGTQVVSFPTGPMIVVAAAFLFLVSLLISPQKGLVFRAWRIVTFKSRCMQENLLKAIWKYSLSSNSSSMTFEEIKGIFQSRQGRLHLLLSALVARGLLKKEPDAHYQLTSSGRFLGRKIVRLHRLWEVYLVQYCGVAKERVHPSAEEMEHIISPAIERELEVLLSFPQLDPHKQPIPQREEQSFA